VSSVDGQLATLTQALSDTDPGVIQAGEPGSYRLRVYARGRDAAAEHITLDSPLETHHLQIWPAPRTTPRLLLSTDQFGGLMGRRS